VTVKQPAHRDVPLCRPQLGPAETKAVVQVLESGWLAHGPKNHELEKQFQALTGAPYAVAMNSCTSALQLAIEARGIGGEVIVPSFTFVASANAVVTAGATPVLVDVDVATRCADPAAIAAAVGPRTEAVMVVHYGGQIADMEPIAALCARHGLALIEDSAETIGATYRGRPQGSWGDGCFSFFPTKNITTGEGGLLTTHDAELHRKARALMAHGIESTTLEREKAERPWLRAATFAGYNFRMSHLLATLGVEQMKRLDELNAGRRRVAARYLEQLAGEGGLELPVTADGRTHVWQMFTVIVRDANRTELLRKLRSAGVGASVHFDPPVHQQPRYRDAKIGPGGLARTDWLAERIVSLPIDPGLGDADVDHVVAALRWALADTKRA
jgi:perosamine synthetase